MKLHTRYTAQLFSRCCLRASSGAMIVLAAVAAPSLSAQQPASQVGTLLVAHGGGPLWDAGVDSLAMSVKTGGPVAISLLMGPGAETHRFQDAVAQLVSKGAKEVVVVPVFVSSHSGHIEQLRYLTGETDSLDMEMMHHLNMSGIERPTERVPIRVTAALDNAPQMARVLASHAKTLAKDPSHQALFLIGHGPNGAEDNAKWMTNLREVADSVRKWTGFRDVKVGLVRDDAPDEVRAEAVKEIRETILLQNAVTGNPVVVVPILVSSGSVSRTKIPGDLHDLPVVYSAVPLLPNPSMARWVEARVKSAANEPAVKKDAAKVETKAETKMPEHHVMQQ
jgi:sirohydrochlorin ferrochelatase